MTNAQASAEIERITEWVTAYAEIDARRALGHTAGCLCQSRPGQSCRELRRTVGWGTVQLLEDRDAE